MIPGLCIPSELNFRGFESPSTGTTSATGDIASATEDSLPEALEGNEKTTIYNRMPEAVSKYYRRVLEGSIPQQTP